MFRESTISAQEISSISQRILGKTMQMWMDILCAQKIQPPTKQKLIHFLSTSYMMNEADAEMISRRYLMLQAADAGSIYTDGYEITVTRTYPVGLHVLESYFTEKSLRELHLHGDMQLIKYNPGKNIRFQLANGEILLANFNGKSAGKCQVTLQHTKLADSDKSEEARSFWKERLQMLADLFTGNDKS